MLNELALSPEILLSVEKPARYVGNEINSVKKLKEAVDIRFAMCFPDVYEIGMSHLGIQIIYDLLNRRDDTWAERSYAPWYDLDGALREKNIPLFALESQEPLKEFDFVGFTLQYELCMTNVLQMLDLAQIPLRSKGRNGDFPLVIGGGPCVYNPEPFADFFDLFYLGEAENVLDDLLDLYKKVKKEGFTREKFNKEKFLINAAKIDGIYVPSLYEVKYNPDSTLRSFEPIDKSLPGRIKKQVCDMSNAPYPLKPVVPFLRASQDRVVLEIQRGCIRGCRFCQAGMVYRPARGRKLEDLKRFARELLSNTGYDEISLSSLSSSDYPHLRELIEFIIGECEGKNINISLPSLRIDTFSLDVMGRVQDVKKSSLTFAPEAGSQRLRDVINKGLTKDEILNGATKAFEGGWNTVKLYFMLGLPTESDEDVVAISDLAEEIAKAYYAIPKENRIGKCRINTSTSFFIPKPFTPFQWARMLSREEYVRKAQLVKKRFSEQLNKKSHHYNWHDSDMTILEGVISRGDRRLSDVIECAYRKGCLFDAWSEGLKIDKWLEAFEECGIDPDFYTLRQRKEDELFPWDFIDAGVTKEFLLREWKKAQKGEVTKNCKEGCAGCGAAVYSYGICNAKRN
ncbi:MAG: TIGR03960 family B12-binding radical SAM protein [Lachnospiraceae bacterium]|jgi:radical SAM family uncharacterized protein|nr:TIGR03960 family B12-binding radical SAM protein [Lachnospiraceae bacterium]